LQFLRKQEKRKRSNRRCGLDPEDPTIHCNSAEDPCDDYKYEEQDLNRLCRCDGTVDETGRKEAVVESLVRRERLRGRRELGRRSKDPPAERRVPEKHLEDQEVHVQERDKQDEPNCERPHALTLSPFLELDHDTVQRQIADVLHDVNHRRIERGSIGFDIANDLGLSVRLLL
jgi:hypothetical protein